jgi:hypothetical protein
MQLCNKLLLKIKCLYANSGQCKYIEKSAYQIMISQLVSFKSCYCGFSTYKICSLPVIAEVHEVLVILNIFSFITHVCLGYHVHSSSAPDRNVCVIQIYVTSISCLRQMIFWLFNNFLHCGVYM